MIFLENILKHFVSFEKSNLLKKNLRIILLKKLKFDKKEKFILRLGFFNFFISLNKKIPLFFN